MGVGLQMSTQSLDRGFSQVLPLLGNQLPPSALTTRWIAGIIGDYPSRYAKSPKLWNAAFDALELDAIFVPLDVEATNLGAVVDGLRSSERTVGFSVTVPYKVEIIKLLDGLDEKARLIGAVNTVARTPDGRLIGCNTDGQGFLDMVLKPLPGSSDPFIDRLEKQRVVLLGAGGAARAVAFSLGEIIARKGHLTIVNRDAAKALELANAVAHAYSSTVDYLPEEVLGDELKVADLVVNATTKGQSGIRALSPHRATCLEPYSALAPANPAVLDLDAFPSPAQFHREWYARSRDDIETNNHLANAALVGMPTDAVVVDLIYAPLETRSLATARWRGIRGLNGKEMNVRQAADAFVNHVMKRTLTEMGWDLPNTHRRVSDVMSQKW
jgi:shikimate dehydrogenase